MPIAIRLLSLIFLLIVPATAAAQGPANNWYFGGGAGINFNTSPPTAFNDGNLETLEGCASISNELGQLLFYTDGRTVYNSNGAIMENGEGLLGDQSSTQSAIIIPEPLSTTVFYVFTVDVLRQLEDSSLQSNGVNYSVVDFSNNPEGAVIRKNIPLLNYSAEKLSAVIEGCDSDTVWMVTLSSGTAQVPDPEVGISYNTFYAYAVTPQGISGAPVKSTVAMNVNDPRGSLKFSPDGKKLAAANSGSGLHLLDFNSETGVISNPVQINIDSPNYAPYGVEFSPNNRFLYIHSSNNMDVRLPPEVHYSSLFQYDLESNNIEESKVLLDEQSLFRGSLQLGPDGKIYRALSRGYTVGLPYLGVIENPNALGQASNYRDRAIHLGTAVSYQGLPPFNQSLFNLIDIIGNDLSNTELDLCADESYTLSYEDFAGATYTWYKDNVQIAGENTAELTINRPPGISLPHTVEYRLSFDLNDGSCEKTGIARITYFPYPAEPASPLQLVQCEDAGNADGLSIFNLNELVPELTGMNEEYSVSFYENQSNANSNSHPVEPFGYENTTSPQTLFARIITPAGCPTVVPFDLIVSSTVAKNALLETCDEEDTGIAEFDLTNADEQLVAGQSADIKVSYFLTEEGALLEDPEFQLPVLYSNETAFHQIIYARLENNNACFAISEINLRVNPRPDFGLIEEVIYCSNTFPETITIEPDLLSADTENYTYEWTGGQTSAELKMNIPGIYTLTVTNNSTGCSRSKSVEIIEKEPAVIENIEVVDASSNNSAVINISGNGIYEFSLNKSGPYHDNNNFPGLEPGFYSVYVRSKEGCGITAGTFSVIGFPKFFTPNEDGFNDLWQVQGVDQVIQPGTTIRIFDRYGKLLKDLDPLSGGWDGTFRGYALPSDDYWFRILLQDGREFKSHFTLKR